jgi:hypothetical protein
MGFNPLFSCKLFILVRAYWKVLHVTCLTSTTSWAGILTSRSRSKAVLRRVRYVVNVCTERSGPRVPLCSVAKVLKKPFIHFAFGTSAGWPTRHAYLIDLVSDSSLPYR